jgi:hypothetical protein
MKTYGMLLAALTLLLFESANAAAAQEWRFKVFLGEQEIGYHRFRLVDSGESREVQIDARFDVRFLFFTAYRYDHRNHEQWRNGCLRTIRARTDDNGKAYAVRGELIANRFVVATGAESIDLPRCVSSFAYWDRAILEQTRLLNAQTGKYIDVTVESIGMETVMVGNTDVPAYAYRLRADDLDIKLWYSSDDRWLALDSTTEDGRQIRYRLF